MAIAEAVRARTRAHPRAVTAILSVLGYAFVAGAFLGVLPLPDLSRGTVVLLGDLIAAVNTVALASLLAGWRFIRRGEVRKHRAAMLTAFALILLFLLLYLLKVGGGFEKSIAASGPVRSVYLAMLAVHVLLSAVSVPVVLHAVVLGLTHAPAELSRTVHPRVGRVAVAAWSLSLALGVLTYVLLNHVYGWEPRGAEALLAVVAGVPGGPGERDGRGLARRGRGADGHRREPIGRAGTAGAGARVRSPAGTATAMREEP